MEQIEFVSGFENMDFRRVTGVLSKMYWSIGISQTEVEKGARYSALVAGVFADHVQIGYARVISDRTRFAYISDVYIEEGFRGRGLSLGLMKYILSHEDVKDVYQWVLKTDTAHGLYEKLGFKPFGKIEQWMEIPRERPER